jgi:hypothetical protein
MKRRVPSICYLLASFLAGWPLSQSLATEQLTNPVTGYNITLDPSSDGKFLGWIELLNGKNDAGYVYFENPQSPPHLSSAKTYIVMSLQPPMFDALLSILRNEKQIRISFFDCQCTGGTPTAMIETGTSIFVAQGGSMLTVAPEEAQHIESVVNRK